VGNLGTTQAQKKGLGLKDKIQMGGQAGWSRSRSEHQIEIDSADGAEEAGSTGRIAIGRPVTQTHPSKSPTSALCCQFWQHGFALQTLHVDFPVSPRLN
jgi:hypothetical protein